MLRSRGVVGLNHATWRISWAFAWSRLPLHASSASPRVQQAQQRMASRLADSLSDACAQGVKTHSGLPHVSFNCRHPVQFKLHLHMPCRMRLNFASAIYSMAMQVT